MKFAVVLIAAIASVACGSVRVARQNGWSTPGWSTPPPTTQGWTTLPPTTQGWTTDPATTGWPSTTQGWSTPPPPSQGWSQPSTAGWGAPAGVLSSIDLNAVVAAAGSGWAGENHSEDVQATGGSGWGPPAQIIISAGGESVVGQEGNIGQLTDQDSEIASSVNVFGVSQTAYADESEVVDALGLEISNAQSGWAAATGEGSSAAQGASSINVNQIAASLGLARP